MARYVVRDSLADSAVVDMYATTNEPLDSVAQSATPLVYVPNSHSGTVTEIDPATFDIVRTLSTGVTPLHVVPAYDRVTLWVTDGAANSLTEIDPRTGESRAQIAVNDPYDIYFAPDGSVALVITAKRHSLDFRDPKTMRLIASERIDCAGLGHLDFTSDDKYAIATCEFSGKLAKIELARRKVVAYLALPGDAAPQDIRASPNGTVFYVADSKQNGVHVIDAENFEQIDLIKTGKGPTGIIVGRPRTPFYITNRGWTSILGGRHGPGSVTVLDPETQHVIATWRIPNGGSPDMGNVSADGKQLWLSGRWDDEVYVIDTGNGALLRRIPVGREPAGVTVWPQPGRFSLGHTGNMR